MSFYNVELQIILLYVAIKTSTIAINPIWYKLVMVTAKTPLRQATSLAVTEAIHHIIKKPWRFCLGTLVEP